MLRSSRQGRKIASRYHASPSSLAKELYDATSPDAFYRRGNVGQSRPETVRNGDEVRRTSGVEIASRTEEKVADLDVHIHTPSPVKKQLDEVRRPAHLVALLPSSASFTPVFDVAASSSSSSSLTMPHTPSLSEGATSATSTAMVMDWSRETSIDSNSLRGGSITTTSSPPPTASALLSKDQDGQDWRDNDDDARSSVSTLTDINSTDLANTPARKALLECGQQPSFVDEQSEGSADDSLIARRPRRTLSKTVKQLEAEESQSLTPRRKRKRSTASAGWASVTDSSTSTPQRRKQESGSRAIDGSPSPAAASTPESSVLSDAPLEFGTPSPPEHDVRPLRVEEHVEPPKRKRGRPRKVPLDEGADNTSALHSQTAVAKAHKPLWKRKVFLTSGLYSNDHKLEETVKAPTRKSFLSTQKERVHYGTERTRASSGRPSAFPMPTDFGYWVLTENRDFRLPFPIAQEIGDIRERMASKRKPPPYKHISQNRYYSRPKLPGEIMVCQCPPTGTCDETCMNRQTQYLCHPKLCPCGERCTNIQFGKRKPVKTEVHWYGARGFGLRILEPIAKDSFIDEYRGEVISYNEMVRRVRDHYKDTGNYYFLMYDAPAGEMLDGGLKGNITRYANHSCDPNCKIQKWLVCGTDEQCAGEFQVALYAGRDIAAGEELTYDYGWSAFSPKSVTGGGDVDGGEACHCGAANCSGIMGRKGSSANSANAETSATALRSKRSTRKRKMKKRLAESRRQKIARAVEQGSGGLVLGGLSSSRSAPELMSLVPAAAADEKGSSEGDAQQKAAVRSYVRDRVSFGFRPPPSQLIDSDNVPILDGKRSRKASSSFAIEDRSYPSPKRKRAARHSNPSPSTSSSRLSASGSLPEIPFDASKYPPDTKFYNRKGEQFDFATLTLKRRGKKPKPYTLEELEEANERHRANLKRLNDLRKFK